MTGTGQGIYTRTVRIIRERQKKSTHIYEVGEGNKIATKASDSLKEVVDYRLIISIVFLCVFGL